MIEILPIHTLLVEITRRCHQQCLHCAFSGGTNKESEVLLSIWPRLLKEAAEIGVRQIDITGGEPFIAPNFFEFMCTASKLGIKIGVCATTGNLINEGSLKRIKKILGTQPIFSILIFPRFDGHVEKVV